MQRREFMALLGGALTHGPGPRRRKQPVGCDVSEF